ncbi:uncharacterized protein LOC123550451 [Mercenaria mercenaria]|uniref:uncharacterized protein LOC123550451 n=1 Tax=Mercenaria mercenaria TaxID=6596 RepID=UPI00234E82F1|nr:uncharacterized protein LOC123550451 [Mercenaria mercenaria]
MKGRRDFKCVVEWSDWRQRRVGGGKDSEQVEKGKVMINRFLACINYREETDDLAHLLESDVGIETYDNYMIKTFEPGTVRSSYCSINSFFDFLLYNKSITADVHKTAKITMSNFSCASKKADTRRRKQLRRQETEVFPKDPSEVLKFFRESTYCVAIRQQWKNGNAMVWKEMRGILLVELAAKNGTRCGEFRNLKYKHVQKARPFKNQPDMRTLVTEDHKTSAFYEATIHLTSEVYKELVEFCTVSRKMMWERNTSDELFVFNSDNPDETSPIAHTMVDRWLKRAWKKAEMDVYYHDYVPSLTKKQENNNHRRQKTQTTPGRRLRQYALPQKGNSRQTLRFNRASRPKPEYVY